MGKKPQDAERQEGFTKAEFEPLIGEEVRLYLSFGKEFTGTVWEVDDKILTLHSYWERDRGKDIISVRFVLLRCIEAFSFKDGER